MERVTDADDPRVAEYLHLRDPEARRRGDVFVVEGRVALERVVDSGLAVRSVLLTPPRAEQLADVVGRLPSSTRVLVAERSVVAATAGFDVHRGILAVAERPGPVPVGDLLSGGDRWLVTEATSDHENLGALFRAAAGFGFGGVLADPRTADPYYRRCVRVSLGWSAVLPHARSAPLADELPRLRAGGVRSVALCPHRGRAVDTAVDRGALDGRVALVVGAEGPGLDADTIDACDEVVRIPMSGSADSLNVATAFAVVAAFDAARRGWP